MGKQFRQRLNAPCKWAWPVPGLFFFLVLMLDWSWGQLFGLRLIDSGKLTQRTSFGCRISGTQKLPLPLLLRCLCVWLIDCYVQASIVCIIYRYIIYVYNILLLRSGPIDWRCSSSNFFFLCKHIPQLYKTISTETNEIQRTPRAQTTINLSSSGRVTRRGVG